VSYKNYQKTYDEKGKFSIKREKRTYELTFDQKTGSFCDSLKFFNFKYKDCEKTVHTLEGIYPVKQYRIEKNGRIYFQIFIERQWYVFVNGFLSPYSVYCH
jgi:hypothetical protein